MPIVLALLAATTSLPPPAAAAVARAAVLREDIDQGRVDSRGRPLARDEAVESDIVRAGAWGRCVLAASPEGASAYARDLTPDWRYRAAPELLRATFAGCLRQSGRFQGYGRQSILRAAIVDAQATAMRTGGGAG